jgi:hypothetical protein
MKNTFPFKKHLNTINEYIYSSFKMAGGEEPEIYFRCLILKVDGDISQGYWTRGPWWKLDVLAGWTPEQKEWFQFVKPLERGTPGGELIRQARESSVQVPPDMVSGTDGRPNDVSWGDENDDWSRVHVLGWWAEHGDSNSGLIPFQELAFSNKAGEGQDTGSDNDDSSDLDDIVDANSKSELQHQGEVNERFNTLIDLFEKTLGIAPTRVQLIFLLEGCSRRKRPLPPHDEIIRIAASISRVQERSSSGHGYDQVAKQLRF